MMKKVTLHDIDGVRMLAIDNEIFDWGIEEEEIKQARRSSAIKDDLLGNIQKHFITSLSSFLGREVTIKEVNDAIESGWLE